MCQRIGLPPISTIGLGRMAVSSLRRVPKPPARITAFICSPSRCAYRDQVRYTTHSAFAELVQTIHLGSTAGLHASKRVEKSFHHKLTCTGSKRPQAARMV